VSAVRRRVLRRGSAALTAQLACGIAGLSLAVAAPSHTATGAIRLAAAGGNLVLSDSKPGATILQAQSMRPGDQVSGAVRIGNTGTMPGALQLSRVPGAESPGAGGALLSGGLRLIVFDVTDAQNPLTDYDGPLGAMPALSLGQLDADHEREYLLVASLPQTAGNAYQGARVSTDFIWTAAQLPVPTPTPSPTPAPVTIPPVTVPPGVPVVPVGGDPTAGGLVATLGGIPVDRVLALPATSSRSCISRRRFVIHLHRPRAVRFSALTVTVNGRTRVKLKGLKARRVKATISLRRLPKGKVVVRIVARTTTGRTAASKRTYHTCAAIKAGTKRKRRKR
jgi:hypothetical protein